MSDTLAATTSEAPWPGQVTGAGSHHSQQRSRRLPIAAAGTRSTHARTHARRFSDDPLIRDLKLELSGFLPAHVVSLFGE